MIPERLTSPIVGLIPTMPLMEAGLVTDPSVSLPTAAAQRQAEVAAPEPELEPEGLWSSAYGLRVCPPRPLHPLIECVERKFAHSLRLVLPRISAPAERKRAATNASCEARQPTSARDPAVVFIASPVSMLSLIRIGIPCRGPRTCPSLRS